MSELQPMTRKMQAFALTMFFAFGAVTAAFVVGNPFGLAFLPGGGNADEAGAQPAAGAPETVYSCPMHPEVIDTKQSDCPICGMKLQPTEAQPAPAEHDAAHGDTLYSCPMHPEVIDTKQSDCPICGMKLQPLEPAAEDVSGVVAIDPVQIQNIGVVSEPARRGAIARTVRTVGFLDFNADKVSWVNTKFSGWIEKVHVTYVGQEVRPGDPLFEIYSPELVTTQEEYLRALEYKASLEAGGRPETLRQAESLLRSTRERLSNWDVSDEQVRALEQRRTAQRRLTIHSPAGGVVTEVMDQALEGMFVKAGMNLYKIADLSTIWVHAYVFEQDLPWVREGQPAAVGFPNDPQHRVRGQILFLYPEVSEKTRTLKICVEVPNPGRRLRAGMYAEVTLEGPPVRDAVLIPGSAVLRSGTRNLVFVDLGEGRFAPREVRLGVTGDDGELQVVEGLEAGEAVVTQAQFMLDSESRVQEAIAKFMERGSAHAGH